MCPDFFSEVDASLLVRSNNNSQRRRKISFTDIDINTLNKIPANLIQFASKSNSP